MAAERLLVRADVIGVLPTPLDALAAAAGIEEVLDLSELSTALVARKPSFLRRVVGALWYREEVAFIDYGQPAVKARFTEAHEIAHRALPWHRASHELFLDDDQTIDYQTEIEIEAEANLMAAHLIFQGQRFHQQALDYDLTLATPTLLAAQFDASLHATIRYYIENHPEPVALAIAGQHRRADGTVPIWTTVSSPAFTAAHGSFASWFPSGGLTVGESEDVRPLGRLAHQALHGEALPTLEIRRADTDGVVGRYRAEAFFNRHCLFVMVTPRNRLRLGRRVRLAAS
jgi:hypothetical protein